MQLSARLHVWPWSCNSNAADETIDLAKNREHIAFYGSPVISLPDDAVIILPSRHEKLHPLGGSFLLPYSNRPHRLFEMPQSMAHSDTNNNSLSITLREYAEVGHWKVELSIEGGMPRYEGFNEKGNSKDSFLFTIILGWFSFFDEMLAKAHGVNKANNRLQWRIVRDCLVDLRKKDTEPFRSIIVDIAEKMYFSLSEIVRSARRVLARERRLLHPGQINETDSACLQWFIRQPGRTMAEKAGQRQVIMAVVRHETLNLHENRVLKDFLERCRNAGKKYIGNAVAMNPAFGTSESVRKVQSLVTICNQLIKDPHFTDVVPPVPGTPPNYVLLNDIRYRRVWYWYQRLLKQEQEQDKIWDWQSRTWADIGRLLMSVAIIVWLEQSNAIGSFRLSALYEGSLRVLNEQLLGSRTIAGSETGPLYMERIVKGTPEFQAVLEIVHSEQAFEHPIASRLGASGGQTYLVVRPLTKNRRPRVLIVWTVHTAASRQIPSWEEIGKSALTALGNHQFLINMARTDSSPDLFGLVFCSNRHAHRSGIEFEDKNLLLLSIPTSPEEWMTAVEDVALALDDMLERMTL